MMSLNLIKRKHPRLKSYDYSQPGAYFVTICTYNRRAILSNIVGRGLAPAEAYVAENTKLGDMAEKQLLALQNRYPYLSVDSYVIMPNHIHAIFVLDNDTAGASPRPTIADIVCAYKSLVTKQSKTIGVMDRLWQTSFYDHIIRDKKDYEEIAKYICENPLRWKYDQLYCEN